jgi:cytochrome c-type biogenesis protein
MPSFEHVSLYTFLAVYAAGLITSLTPCVYPIIPLVVGYLGSRAGTFRQRLIAALAYVLGLSLVYAVLGMIAGLTGSLFGSLTTNAWVYLVFGIFILVLGGNMMEWYNLPLLSGLKPREASDRKSFFWQPLLVGASSGLVASPCTAPVLAALLVYIGSRQSVLSGGLMMFLFALGMSTLLLVIGLFAGLSSRLPKSGVWMVRVKKIMALLIIVAGIYFIFKAGSLY